MRNFLAEAIARFKAPTPAFFKKLIVFGSSLTGLSLSLIAIPGLPAAIVSLTGYLATAGAAIIAVAKFAVQNTDPNQTPQQ